MRALKARFTGFADGFLEILGIVQTLSGVGAFADNAFNGGREAIASLPC